MSLRLTGKEYLDVYKVVWEGRSLMSLRLTGKEDLDVFKVYWEGIS